MICITGKAKEYSSWADIEYEMTYPLEEMVMVTDGAVTSSSDDPWGQQIGQVFVKTTQIGNYSNQPYLTQKTENIFSPFKEDAVMETLASRGQFFPTEYLLRENIEGLFEESSVVRKKAIGKEEADSSFPYCFLCDIAWRVESL